MLLTKVLAFYGDTINSRLANLQRYIFAEDSAEHSETELAARFMETLTNLVKLGNLPSSYSAINEQKLAQIVKDALAEAHPDYPVPKFMNKDECEHIVRSLMAPA